ncbi:maleylpyruvate isomerase family mycothiol-dependent enzyme (plasmid) [Rhizobium sp. NIBRBAC000502774]|nr:maleylpyruvate isomerase family mycothiol-dependent enzyme [Rhizobium sp. NIBRBAC000502774]
MSISIDQAARQALRERQGSGARYDSPFAPASDLALARLGTAYFARRLNEMNADDLSGTSMVPGWTRRHVVAYVGYHARFLARIVDAARRGLHQEELVEPEAQNEDLDFGATLPDHALRYLFKHSAIHLDVEWRDANETHWAQRVEALSGDEVAVSDTPWLRAREIWLRAMDLGAGASVYDVPIPMAWRLLQENAGDLAQGARYSIKLRPTDHEGEIVVGAGQFEVRGRLHDLLRWASGRGAAGVIVDPTVPVPHLW